MNKLEPVYHCSSCGWQPRPGQLINCDSIENGPWYCPTCNDALPHVILMDDSAVKRVADEIVKEVSPKDEKSN